MRKAALLALVIASLAPGAAQAASIGGTVSDEVTHVGIAGVDVCPTPQPYTFEVDCVQTDASGHYSFAGLQPAQYMLSFSAAPNNLPYVSEFYDNKPNNLGADLVTLGSVDAAREVDVELARGGSISGTLTDEESGEPVVEMAACAWGDADTYERCDKSDAFGHYQINGLPSGDYSVRYENWNLADYLPEFYEDEETWAQATRATVAAPGLTGGIDGHLAKGAEILGHVSDVETGAPLYDVMVCASEEGEPERGDCNWTDTEGNYALRGMPAATYLLEFGVQTGPFSRSVGQWWDGAASLEEADPITIAPPESRTGIDGELPGWYGSRPPGSEPAPRQGEDDAAPPVPLQPSPVVKRPALPKCRKGFHRKPVKGKKRCVRKQGRHHGRHRRRAG